MIGVLGKKAKLPTMAQREAILREVARQATALRIKHGAMWMGAGWKKPVAAFPAPALTPATFRQGLPAHLVMKNQKWKSARGLGDDNMLGDLGLDPMALALTAAKAAASASAPAAGTTTSPKYARVDAVQKALAVLNAEVYAIDQVPWDIVAAQVAKSRPAGAPYMQPFAGVSEKTASFMRAGPLSLVVTSTYFPSDAAMALGESAAVEIRRMVDYVKTILPEIAPAVSAQGAKTLAAVSQSSLSDPKVVGDAAFKEELAKRAAALGQGGLNVMAIAAVGAAAVALIMILKK